MATSDKRQMELLLSRLRVAQLSWIVLKRHCETSGLNNTVEAMNAALTGFEPKKEVEL